MIKNHIEAIQEKLQNSPHISAETKASLLQLVAELEKEVEILSHTHQADAEKIALYTDASANETSLGEKPSHSTAIGDLRSSVEGFETSHPRLTNVVSQLATTLSNMGI